MLGDAERWGPALEVRTPWDCSTSCSLRRGGGEERRRKKGNGGGDEEKQKKDRKKNIPSALFTLKRIRGFLIFSLLSISHLLLIFYVVFVGFYRSPMPANVGRGSNYKLSTSFLQDKIFCYTPHKRERIKKEISA